MSALASLTAHELAGRYRRGEATPTAAVTDYLARIDALDPRVRAFLTVTLPQIKASVFAGAVFAFISAIDETIIALFVSGGQYQTLTKRMFTALRDEIDPTIASISTLLTAASFLLVLLAMSGQKKEA